VTDSSWQRRFTIAAAVWPAITSKVVEPAQLTRGDSPATFVAERSRVYAAPAGTGERMADNPPLSPTDRLPVWW